MRRSAVWKGSLSFGLLNIPVSLQTAQEDKELHFTMLDDKTMAKIHYKKVDAETGREVPNERIVKGYEYDKDEYVVMTDEDFEKANPKATQSIDIEDFVPLADIDLMMFEKPYYLVPQKDGAKGYFLLRDALKKTGKVAIAKFILRDKQHLSAILPMGDYLILEQLRFAHNLKEIHEVDFLKDTPKARYTARELETAEALIEDMSAPWMPEKYKDTYFDDVMKVIKEKIKHGREYVLPEPEKEEEAAPTPATDLLPLLRKSLEAKKNEAGSKKTKSNPKNYH